jgi:hypothetical protein
MQERRRGHGRRRGDSPDAAAAPHLRDALESQARMIRALARTRDGIVRQRDALRNGLDALDEALGRGDVDAARAVVGYLRWEQDRIAEEHAAGATDGGSPRGNGDVTGRPRDRHLDATG